MRLADVVYRHVTGQSMGPPINLCFASLTIYALLRHSPENYGKFKWLMVNVVMSELIFIFYEGLLYHPVPMFPAYSGVCLGPISQWLGAHGCYLGFVIFIFFIGYAIMALTLCFIFRYALLAESNWFGEWFRRTPSIILTFFGLLSLIFTPMVCLYFAEDSPQSIRAIALQLRPEWIDEIDQYVYFGADPTTAPIYLFMLTLALALTINSGITTFFSLLINRELGKHRAVMSANTMKMHRRLINILMAQTIIPFILLTVPISFEVYMVFTNTVNDELMHFLLIPVTYFPIVNDLVFLGFSPPHRRGLATTFGFAKKVEPASSPASVETQTAHQPTLPNVD